MNKQQQSMLLQSASSFPPPKGTKLSYGTAGFRADASILQSTVFRIGILAALRSLKTGGSVIGLMITASHNKVSDNGVKIADPSGGMVTQDWEPFADSIANAPDPESLIQKENRIVSVASVSGAASELINEFAKKENIPLDGAKAATVLLGRDTRPSGESLVKAAKHGICSVAGAVATDMGIVTTPQLHWMVRARNKGLKASELDYFEQLSSSFRCLIDLIPKKSGDNNPVGKLIVDCANGVGGEKLQVLKEKLNGLHLEIRNSGESGILNEGVGADYVQKEKVAPEGFGPADVGIRCASLDGDADRLVYFTVIPNGNNKIELVDGDKILSLFALFIKDQLSILGDKNEYQPRVGVVQTAYANGASTKYLNQLGLQVIFTPTGVKYLHGKAEEYDIGLEKQNAVKRLWAVTKLINQAVGDALSGLLLVEAILQHMGWSVDKWNELYHDLPSRQLKENTHKADVLLDHREQRTL
ncbi:Alpha-D-phosphohexomutase, alpha/beta/alpha domain I [Cynara cardunculus var. scolymus]|uniref:Alpha-D-phosphohexomutase, alpha/beta/alpha domain I n=1 Tax=Cynara cardunculus var. scolymus TaxID=59895 RepID=A0A118JTD4_CYNCS|nr:Alpha-D-phosphohexomutase, alpha/beta/alpha domain I [Cynara cardunculus var. scolymus]